MRYEALTPGMSSTSFLDNFYRQYDFSKAPDFRGLNRSVSQMELYSPTSSIRSGMNSKMSTSSLDLSPGRPFSTSPQPIQGLAAGEHRYLDRMRAKKEKEEWNLANGINFSYTSPYMSDSHSLVKA